MSPPLQFIALLEQRCPYFIENFFLYMLRDALEHKARDQKVEATAEELHLGRTCKRKLCKNQESRST